MNWTYRMISIALCVFFSLIYGEVEAQQYDKVWAVGSPVSIMTFDTDSILLGAIDDTTTRSFNAIGNICDSDGNFLFYSNGVYVRNRYGDIMPHGDSLSYPSQYYNQVVYQGMPNEQGVVCLPDPGNSNRYYIFHFTDTDTLINPGGYESTNLYYSLVDMSLDSGRGDLVEKNVIILQGLLSASRLAACRHSNGRDWWIVKPAWHENIYYTFLLTPTGIQGPFPQQIGPQYGLYTELPSYTVFSPDGTKYASITSKSRLVLLDFDRCTGLFSNPDSFYNNNSFDPTHDPNSGGNSLAFSASGRFLYIGNSIELNQYDLWSSQIHDSIRIKSDTIADYQMNLLQLAPNGKIYLSCWNGGSYAIHVINYPDSLGLACGFQFLGQPVLSVNSVAIPYFPNFRLAAIPGCDTVPNGIADISPPVIRIEPNPASTYTTVRYLSGASGIESIALFDNLGEMVMAKTVIADTGSTELDIRSLAAGMYIVRVTAGGGGVINAKLSVER